MNKRYAIVRVDDVEEEIKWLDILDEIVKKRKIFIDYGDTKRQLIKKAALDIAKRLYPYLSDKLSIKNADSVLIAHNFIRK